MPLDFSEYAYFAALSGSQGVTSERSYTGIRRILSLHLEHVYRDNCWIETSVKMNYCAILRYTTNTGHYRQHISILRSRTNQIFLKNESQIFRENLSEFRDRCRLQIFSQNNCIDCSPRDIINTRTHTLQIYSMYLT